MAVVQISLNAKDVPLENSMHVLLVVALEIFLEVSVDASLQPDALQNIPLYILQVFAPSLLHIVALHLGVPPEVAVYALLNTEDNPLEIVLLEVVVALILEVVASEIFVDLPPDIYQNLPSLDISPEAVLLNTEVVPFEVAVHFLFEVAVAWILVNFFVHVDSSLDAQDIPLDVSLEADIPPEMLLNISFEDDAMFWLYILDTMGSVSLKVLLEYCHQ